MLRYNPHGKRMLDLLLSAIALLFLSPLLMILCTAISVESKGGPFFFQRRIGKGFVPFRLIKFRSMRTDRTALSRQFEPGDRRRVTRMGDFLRKTKLDELPELFNVLCGDMSIVGPRPEVEKYVRIYPKEFCAVLEVRPGLSDFASIKYRNEEKMLSGSKDPDTFYVENILPDKLRLAREYVRRLSFKADVTIIIETIKSVLGVGVTS